MITEPSDMTGETQNIPVISRHKFLAICGGSTMQPKVKSIPEDLMANPVASPRVHAIKADHRKMLTPTAAAMTGSDK